MTDEEVLRDMLQKWARRGYVDPDAVGEIATDIALELGL